MQLDYEYAYCWRSGLIGFASSESEIPDGTLLIAKHDSKEVLHAAVNVCARHAYDDGLLVPGIPEAEDDDEALRALSKFIPFVEKRL